MKSPIVGIDFGTTNSSICAVIDGEPRILPVDGEPLLPSVVALGRKDGPLVGRPALNLAAVSPESVVRSVKRWMSTDRVFDNGGRQIQAPEIAAMILSRLLDAAAETLGARPEKAVISVPARSGQDQRLATIKAGELAGVEVVRLVNEPTAASLAYDPGENPRTILVYDLGGGTFDATVLRVEKDLSEVRSSWGDTKLGGDDFDAAIADLILSRLGGRDLGAADAVRGDPIAMARLVIASEEAKRKLSADVETRAAVEFIGKSAGKPLHLDETIARWELEELLLPWLEKTAESVDRVLDESSTTPAELDAILFVGGSTRIPMVTRFIRERYGIEPDRSLNPEEAVALGAGVQAAIVSGAPVDRILVDVCTHALGVSVLERFPFEFMMNSVITPRNTPVPSTFVEVYSAMHPRQKTARLFVFQGGDPDPRRNRCLGRIDLEGLKRRKGDDLPRVRVEFRHDLDGVVNVRTSDVAGGAFAQAKLSAAAADSDELMRIYIGECEKDGIAPGPPELISPSPAPNTAQPARASAESAGEKPAGGVIDAVDLEKKVKRLWGRMPDLEKKHPDHGENLKNALLAAREALRSKPPELERAEEAVESVMDVLFELGEFF